jgi:branched-chain amino acid transport system substrate-binding protein
MALLAAVTAMVVATITSAASAQGSDTTGVTDKSVKFGYISSQTGVASSLFKRNVDACKARIARANAEGGVNGRKIEVVFEDDKSGAGNVTGTENLVDNEKVFAILNNSSFGFLGYRGAIDAGVPMIGGGFDGTYYSDPKNADLVISMFGNGLAPPGLNYDTVPKVMKQLGASKVGVVAYGVSPSSVAAAKTMQEYAVPTVKGLEGVYTNTAVDFGTTDVGPVVLGIKNAGADPVYLPLQTSSNIAIVQGLAQNNVPMKATMLASGYGQDLLDSPVAKTLTPSTVFVLGGYTPVENKTKGTKQFQADLKKYAKYTGVPDWGTYGGYIMCDLAVRGLEAAGKDLTRTSFVDGVRSIDAYDQAGLTCQPVNMTKAAIRKVPDTSCSYFAQVKDGKFVIMNKGKPYPGKLVGSKEALAANEAGDNTAVTTTAAPAS